MIKVYTEGNGDHDRESNRYAPAAAAQSNDSPGAAGQGEQVRDVWGRCLALMISAWTAFIRSGWAILGPSISRWKSKVFRGKLCDDNRLFKQACLLAYQELHAHSFHSLVS